MTYLKQKPKVVIIGAFLIFKEKHQNGFKHVKTSGDDYRGISNFQVQVTNNA